MTNTPISDLTTTWNDGATVFSAIKMNVTDTASDPESLLLNLQTGSVEAFQIGKNGHTAQGLGSTVDEDVDSSPSWQGLNQRFTATDVAVDFSYGQYCEFLPVISADSSTQYYGLENRVRIDSGTSDGFNFTSPIYGVSGYVEAYHSGAVSTVYGVSGYTYRPFGTADVLYGTYGAVEIGDITVTGKIAALYGELFFDGTATVPGAYGCYVAANTTSPGLAVGYGNWVGEQSGGTLNYAFWYDGPGVARIKEEGGTTGAVYAWYNPTFTKYTPGAANYERGVLQWNSNVLQIGLEAGGTGTPRVVQVLAPAGLTGTAPYANLTPPVTVSALPSASTAGMGARAFVTDALLPTFGATVAGSGAVPVPVYSDGTNWKVG